jgi:HAD superfamily hydrolase (TIGR01490 family)
MTAVSPSSCGPSTAAFFDLDRTLIRGSANLPFAVAAFRAGMVPKRDLLSDLVNAVTFIVRGASDERSARLRGRILRAVAGHDAAELGRLGERFIPRLATTVLPEAQEALDEHARRGDARVIVSASPIELVSALAEALGLEGAIGTRGEIVDGRYTGRLSGSFCYGEGKVVEVRRLAAERGYDLARCTAYSDSLSDLPFLECVGTAVAVNPDRALREVAERRGWTILEVARPRLLGGRAKTRTPVSV